MNKNNSDASWYCRKDIENERFYEIFFSLCRKFHVSWASADKRERDFIEEVTRVTFERERAGQIGEPLSSVRPSFAPANEVMTPMCSSI